MDLLQDTTPNMLIVNNFDSILQAVANPLKLIVIYSFVSSFFSRSLFSTPHYH